MSRAVTILFGLVFAADSHAGLREVRDCVEANMPRMSTVQKLALDVQEDGEQLFEARLTLYWRRLEKGERRIVLRFREPDDLARASLLIQQKQRRRPTVHIYLPEYGKPRSISSRGELEGFLGRANLGVEELELLFEPLSDKKLELLNTERLIDGRKVWVVEERDDDEDKRYARIMSFIDQDYCTLLRAELYDENDVAMRVLEIDADDVSRIEESWVPMRLVFRDLARGTETLLRMEDVEIDTPLSPSLLTVDSFPRLSR